MIRLVWARLRGASIALTLLFALLSGVPPPERRLLRLLPAPFQSVVLELDAARNLLIAPLRKLFELFQFTEEWKLFSAPIRETRFLMSIEARTSESTAWEVLYRPHHPEHAFLDEVLEYRRMRGNWHPTWRGPSPGYEGFVTWVARRIFAAYPAYRAMRVRMEEVELLGEGRGYTPTGRYVHERVRARGEVPPWP